MNVGGSKTLFSLFSKIRNLFIHWRLFHGKQPLSPMLIEPLIEPYQEPVSPRDKRLPPLPAMSFRDKELPALPVNCHGDPWEQYWENQCPICHKTCQTQPQVSSSNVKAKMLNSNPASQPSSDQPILHEDHKKGPIPQRQPRVPKNSRAGSLSTPGTSNEKDIGEPVHRHGQPDLPELARQPSSSISIPEPGSSSRKRQARKELEAEYIQSAPPRPQPRLRRKPSWRTHRRGLVAVQPGAERKVEIICDLRVEHLQSVVCVAEIVDEVE